MLHRQNLIRLLLVVVFGCCCGSGRAAVPDLTSAVPNADFTQGKESPASWQRIEGQGRWVDREILEVTGDGTDSGYWRCDYAFAPGALYRFEARGRGAPSGGSAILGPVFANRDYHTPSADWTWVGHVFRVPDEISNSFLRLGHWRAVGSIQYDAVRLLRVIPVHQQLGKQSPITLGDGERIQEGRYSFSGTFSHEGSNYHRTLESATASFNSDRWVLGPGQQITYAFRIPGSPFRNGQLSLNVNYFTRGGCTAQIRSEGTDWVDLGTQSSLGTLQTNLPASLFPAASLFLRLKSSSDDTSLQVNRIELSADLTDPPRDATGQTFFAAVESETPAITVQRMSLLSDNTAGEQSVQIEWKNNATEDLQAAVEGTVSSVGSTPRQIEDRSLSITAGATSVLSVPLKGNAPGIHQLHLTLSSGNGTEGKSSLALPFEVPEFYRTDYGARISCEGAEEFNLWWCPATHKIPRRRAVPERQSAAAELSAARNDFEAVQVVLHPDEDLKGLTAQASDLVGPDGTRLTADHVSILRVAYHFVRHPTDRTGVVDDWPDALPPLSQPIDLTAGQNQPLWILVHVPTDAVPGDYRGEIRFQSEEKSVSVPVKLHVWDFALPETNHIETAFGLSLGDIVRYHGLRTDQQKRLVWEQYLKCFSEHRISPYDPVPMDPIRVQFLADTNPPRAEVDFSAFDSAFRHVIENYHFTGYRLPIRGMGSGTFHARSEPEIEGYGAQTPQYQAMFASYVGQLEKYFRERGWLHLPYVYWFDEPDPKDYAFVADGFARLKKLAPGLRRMLTEEPGDNELANLVDIWCPVTPNYHPDSAELRRRDGDRFWWYVCTGPKAPYCTLFIDHPATELRVWLWQTWQRDIQGILVWQSNYWTSDAAFPEEPQNPYDDPMGYVSGYSTARGVKNFWGNGDGRFVYPPEAAATAVQAGSEPVLAPPVSSLRFEMLREGIEDYEMLYLLREKLQQQRESLAAAEIERYESLLRVPDAITRDMTTFTTDPNPVDAQRAAVADAIEQLQRRTE